MQSINFPTPVLAQHSPINVPLYGVEDASARVAESEGQQNGISKNAGHILSQALLALGGDEKTRKVAERFERGDVSASSLRQLSPMINSMSASSAAHMVNALDKAKQQMPELQSAFQQMQGFINEAQFSRQKSSTDLHAGRLARSVADSTQSRADFRSLVIPSGLARVSAQQAERSMQNVMSNSTLPASKLMNLNIEELALHAANLGIKTFGDTASAVTKSQKIATEARKTLMDKQVDDFAKDLEKSIKQQENAKKGGIFGAILKWIAPVLSVVTMVFVPMSLPLMVGMVAAAAASTASAALNTAMVAMGTNAPAWMQKLNSVMDWASTGLNFVVGASAMWVGAKIANTMIQGLQTATSVAKGVGDGVTGVMNTKLQKEINEIGLKMDWREVLMNLFKQDSENNSKRLERATDSWSTTNQKLIDVMLENATLRSRIAKSMI